MASVAERAERADGGEGDWRPRPDPTVLTTAQLVAAIANLREIIETRLAGMDRAIKLLQDIHDKLPAMIDEKVKHLQEVHEEKFVSIGSQFRERDERVQKTAEQVTTAVNAAFQAAKEVVTQQNLSSANAISKSEAATQKQIDQQGMLINTATKGLEDKISDAKERLTRIESLGIGQAVQVKEQREGKAESQASFGLIGAWIFGAMGMLIGAAGIIIAIAKH